MNQRKPDIVEEARELLTKAAPACECGSKHCNGKTALNGVRFVCDNEYGMSTCEYHVDDPEAAMYSRAPEITRAR